MCEEAIIDLYERHASEFDRDRGHSLHGERAWLDTFLLGVPDGGTVLDVGCGTGSPIAAYILQRGFRVVGVDASPSMIRICSARFPECEWVLQDMRVLTLGRRFDAILAWDSFFHLGVEQQRAMFPRFAAHALPGSPLLFTSGPREGEAIGSYCGEPLYHASLDPTEYSRLLSENRYVVQAHIAEDPACGEHTVWLANHEARMSDSHILSRRVP